MFAKSYGATTLGVDGLIIDVEVDAGFGFPAFDIVGLPDTAVRESKERRRISARTARDSTCRLPSACSRRTPCCLWKRSQAICSRRSFPSKENAAPCRASSPWSSRRNGEALPLLTSLRPT